MIREALELIGEKAAHAAGAKDKVEIVKLPGEPEHYFATIDPNGTIEKHVARHGPRRETIRTVAQVAEYVQHARERLKANPTVWISPGGVSIVLHDGPEDDRRERAFAGLAYTPQWQTLGELEEKTLTQREFVRLLRIDLHDCLSQPGHTLLRLVRAMDFSAGATGHAEIGHGRESLGREVQATVQSKHGDLPEVVPLTVRIYTDPALLARRTVLCGLDVDAVAQQFQFAPLPGQLDDALNQELADLETRIEADCECPVFLGIP